MRASANTPAETTGACVARFPVAGSLPRYNGGSASASCFSRPARRLLAFSPAWSLNRLTRPFDARVLQSISLPPRTALAATNRSDSCCAGFAPARRKRLSTAHVARGIEIAVVRASAMLASRRWTSRPDLADADAGDHGGIGFPHSRVPVHLRFGALPALPLRSHTNIATGRPNWHPNPESRLWRIAAQRCGTCP